MVPVLDGAWSLELPPGTTPAFPDGQYVVRATVSDAAGNPAEATARTITVDVVVPTATNLAQQKTYLEDASSVALDDIVLNAFTDSGAVTATLKLASPAAGYITGATLLVDGGLTMA